MSNSLPSLHLLRKRALRAIGIIAHAKVVVNLKQTLLARRRFQEFFPARIVSEKTRRPCFESAVRFRHKPIVFVLSNLSRSPSESHNELVAKVITCQRCLGCFCCCWRGVGKIFLPPKPISPRSHRAPPFLFYGRYSRAALLGAAIGFPAHCFLKEGGMSYVCLFRTPQTVAVNEKPI